MCLFSSLRKKKKSQVQPKTMPTPKQKENNCPGAKQTLNTDGHKGFWTNQLCWYKHKAVSNKMLIVSISLSVCIDIHVYIHGYIYIYTHKSVVG